MSHRPSLSLVLTIFISVSLGLVFFWLSGILLQGGVIEASSSRIYLTLVGISLGSLSTQPTLRLIKLFTRQILARTTIRTQINFPSVFLGSVLGLLSTVYIDHILTLNNAYDPYRSGIIALALILAFYWLNTTLIRRFTFIRTLIRSLSPFGPILTDSKVLDTSALIDGRLNAIINSRFLEPPFLVPNFIVKELQNLADTSESLKRQRGRAGLELLNQLFHNGPSFIQLFPFDQLQNKPVDDRLVSLCTTLRTTLITTDYNLTRVAQLSGVRVLNMNILATAMVAPVLPGDQLSIAVSQKGRARGQGVGFLPDGTMVVIDAAQDLLGKQISVIVTRNLQSETGRMIFAKVA